MSKSAIRDGWVQAAVGCHWTKGNITISTTQDPEHPDARYVIVRHPGVILGHARDWDGARVVAGELPPYGITDFGVGPADDTQGIVFRGSWEACLTWLVEHATDENRRTNGEARYGLTGEFEVLQREGPDEGETPNMYPLGPGRF